MSEVDARPPATRGRSSHRGGRGGFGRGGPRGGSRKPNNGTSNDTIQVEESLEDQGELGEMKKKYASELSMLKELFPDWTDVDLVFALQEADGDVPSTVDRITQGSVSQFAEVKSAKDRARSKVKEPSSTAAATEKPGARGGRGRGGHEGTRGGRGRGSDRGRAATRGGRGGHATTNGAAKDVPLSVPTTESTAWDDSAHTSTTESSWDHVTLDAEKDAGDTGQSAWQNVMTSEATPATASEGAKSSLIPEGGPKKSWASMFAPKPAAPLPAKKAPAPQPPPAELVASGEIPGAVATEPEPLLPPNEDLGAVASEASPIEPPRSSDGSELMITPSKDPLTEENVEHLPDESHPPATLTTASTAGSADPRNLTPLPSQQAPIGRPPMGGYAASAQRAAGMSGRSASFQRRVQEQQEAVVMPGHNAVDRAAVQFGSMGINGEPGLDVDEDREEPETRHAPQHSPPSQPRASLPPAPRQTIAPQEAIMPETLPTPKQAPGLPPASQQNQQQMQEAVMGPGIPGEPPQINQTYSQYARYGQPGMQQQDSGAQQQKPYDPFSQYDQYGTHAQQAPQQQQSQTGFGGLSSAPNDYSSYYTTDHQRGAYSNYYAQNYGPQDVRSQLGQGQQDTGMGQQRSTSGLGAAPNESAFASQVQQQAQSRFADPTGSGHNTPNPPVGVQQQAGLNAQQTQHSMHQAQSHHQHQQQHQQQHPQQQHQQQQSAYGAQAGFPYGHQYYNSPYPQAYSNQFGYNTQLGSYSGYPAKQSNMYGASHGYNMGPQSSYDQHSASPANASSFGQNQQSNMRSASGMSAGLTGLEDYGRQSGQSHQQNSGFGAMNDPFGRSGSGFGTQSGYGQQSMAGQEDSLKPFSDAKGGPSPALGQPGGRPGSATNSAGGSAQSGLPPPQSHQSGFGGGYPGFTGQGQYGGLGGLGTQQHGQGGYGAYGAGGFSQAYGSYGNRGGWGSNYGAH